jgi:hypothetical protein
LLIFVVIITLSLLSNTESITANKKDKFKSVGGAAGVAKQCIASLAESMPPSFCWKKGADAGIIPYGCPRGYFRSIALCYKHCKPGFGFWGGVCWHICKPGFVNHGLTCFKWLFDWYFKPSYIPHILTNFASNIPCPGQMYKAGALCYRNCEVIGMYNCGIGACTSEHGTCGQQILNMIAKVGEGILTGVVTILSMGSSTGATTATKSATKATLKATLKGAGRKLARSASKQIKKILSGKFKKVLKKKAIKKIKQQLRSKLKGQAMAAIDKICNMVWDKTIKKAVKTPPIQEFSDSMIDSIDVLGVGDMVRGCQDVSDGGLNCAKGIVEGLSGFDPTGILTIASAFMHPTCDVPVSGRRRRRFY